MVSAKTLVQLALLAAPALCSPCKPSQPIPPSEDPWYTAPEGYEDAAPGTVLRIRPAPGNLTSLATDCAATYNLLFRTTNSRDEPTWAVTTLFVPKNRTGSLLSYQIPYDSADINQSPSYALYSDMQSDVSDSLSKGWFVSVPDYEGPLASFTAGVMSGHATLDSVRAVLSKASDYSLPEGSKYALWGYSGGALASEWAAELQKGYAPELSFAGAALGGLTPNVTSVLLTINGGLSVELAVNAMIGITNQWPDVYQELISKLKTSGPYNRTTFLAVADPNIPAADEPTFFDQDISNYFVDGMADMLNPTTDAIVNQDGIMGTHGVPQMPVYAYKAIGDEISVVADTDALVDKLCAAGANILYQRNTVGGHIAEASNGHPAAVAFLDSVFDGAYAASYNTTGCTIQTVTVDLDSSPLKRDVYRRYRKFA